MNEQPKKELVNQSAARLYQVKVGLLQAAKNEKEALEKLTGSVEDTADRRLAIERDFLRLRVELYNEQANVVGQLLNDMMPAVDDAKVRELAKDVDLAAKLKEKRQPAATRAQADGNQVWPCNDCLTGACVTCVYATCVSSCQAAMLG